MGDSVYISFDTNKNVFIPLYESSVTAGFPSPAEDYIEKKLDLNDLLIKRPAATFFVRVKGDSMKDAAIFCGDLLIVDRSLPAKNHSIVIAIYNGEFTVKRLKVEGKTLFLQPENPEFSPIKIQNKDEFEIWGVVSYVIHRAC